MDLTLVAPEVGKDGQQMTLTVTTKDKEIRIPLALFPAGGTGN
jgi:hypothetical protein